MEIYINVITILESLFFLGRGRRQRGRLPLWQRRVPQGSGQGRRQGQAARQGRKTPLQSCP